MLTTVGPAELVFVAFGALAAGFINGFAGFGTALVASGLWFLVLPAPLVPPLIVLSAIAGQLVGLFSLYAILSFRKAGRLISGGILGVPLGVGLLTIASPAILKMTIGIFLITYSVFQLTGRVLRTTDYGGRGFAEHIVGFIAGILGGFAGLSGPLPLIWLQHCGLSSSEQRARYQPFNLLILCLAGVLMAVAGQIDSTVIAIALLTVPLSLLGAIMGVRFYSSVSEETFRRAVVVILLCAGVIIVLQSFR